MYKMEKFCSVRFWISPKVKLHTNPDSTSPMDFQFLCIPCYTARNTRNCFTIYWLILWKTRDSLETVLNRKQDWNQWWGNWIFRHFEGYCFRVCHHQRGIARCIAWSHLPKCCDRNVHIKLFSCTVFVKKYNSKWFCPEWRKHCTLHWSCLLKKQQLQQTIWVYPSSRHKDAQNPQFAAWKTAATAAIPSSGAGLGMAGESHSLKVSQVWHVSTIIALLKANTFGKAELAHYIFYLYSTKYVIIASEIACLTITGPNKYFNLRTQGRIFVVKTSNKHPQT